jgi:hypothetical protein
MGGQVINFPFSHSAFLRPSGRDLRLELGVLPEWSLENKTLE